MSLTEALKIKMIFLQAVAELSDTSQGSILKTFSQQKHQLTWFRFRKEIVRRTIFSGL